MVFHTLSFIHHERRFTIEADGWVSREAVTAAMIDLQSWTLNFSAAETAALHRALTEEAEALIHEAAYDRDATPLPALRVAQRLAVRSGLGRNCVEGQRPTITLEAG